MSSNQNHNKVLKNEEEKGEWKTRNLLLGYYVKNSLNRRQQRRGRGSPKRESGVSLHTGQQSANWGPTMFEGESRLKEETGVENDDTGLGDAREAGIWSHPGSPRKPATKRGAKKAKSNVENQREQWWPLNKILAREVGGGVKCEKSGRVAILEQKRLTIDLTVGCCRKGKKDNRNTANQLSKEKKPYRCGEAIEPGKSWAFWINLLKKPLRTPGEESVTYCDGLEAET